MLRTLFHAARLTTSVIFKVQETLALADSLDGYRRRAFTFTFGGANGFPSTFLGYTTPWHLPGSIK